MKKLLLSLFLALSLVLVLAACGGNGTPDPTPEPTPAPTETPAPTPEPTPEPEEEDEDDSTEAGWAADLRGTWDGFVYSNPSLGLQFTLPDGWFAATDEEIANVMGISADIFDDEAWEEVFAQLDILALIDMMAIDLQTNVNVNITIERLVFPNNRLTEAQYLQHMDAMSDLMGMDFSLDFPSPVRIGAYDWHVYGAEMLLMGSTARGFINIQNGFARIITITYNGDTDALEEVLAAFGDLVM